MCTIIVKACGLWVPLVPLAIVNGAIREGLLVPALGQRLALSLSGVFLSVLIVLFAVAVSPRLGATAVVHYIVAGIAWLWMTVVFEFLFGHYARGKSVAELLAAYNVVEGNLWVLVLLSTAVSPYLGAKLRRLV